MKRFLTLLLALTLTLSLSSASARTQKVSFECEDVALPAIYRQISVPAGIRDDYGEVMNAVEYDLGMRYSGRNDDLSISIWCNNGVGGKSPEEIAQSYVEQGYEVEKSKLNGDEGYLLTRSIEGLTCWLLTDAGDSGFGPSVAYTLSISAYTPAGEALRDEIFASVREWGD